MKRLALLLALALVAPAAATDAPFIFEGRVEAGREAVLSSRLNGVVAKILFEGGEAVAAGDPLIRLDDADAKLDLAAAEAALAEAVATQDLARQADDRANALRARGVTAEGAAEDAAAALARADAALKAAEVDLARATLAMERTVIRAPISGLVGRPLTAVGAFLEAEAGPPLARIVSLDPVTVAYAVPYERRLAVMAETGATSVDALFERIALTLVLPSGDYGHESRPHSASAEIDAEGALTVRADFANPDHVLRPGLAVTIHARIAP